MAAFTVYVATQVGVRVLMTTMMTMIIAIMTS
jgi:hypothetical protein